MSLVKSTEFREEQRTRLKLRIDELVDSAIANPTYSAGILPIDDLDHVISSSAYSRICIVERNLMYQIEQLKNDIIGLKNVYRGIK